MPPPRALAAVSLAVLLAACGGGGGSSQPPVPPRPTWLPVDGMECADGNGTGIGIVPGRSDAVLVYLAGGGACWSDTSCSAERSFDPAYFTLAQSFASGTIFDRRLAGNPYAEWTFVFVPYCTGDVHAGDTGVRFYAGVPWRHHGLKNLQAAAGAITSGLARPARVAVAGSSAGGLGALVAYGLLRDVWDPEGGTTAELVDDSGPTFVGTATPPALLSAWWDAWGLATAIGGLCGLPCTPKALGGEGDLSAVWDALHARHPADRLALVSTTQDGTMRGFLADPAAGPSQPMSPLVFDANLAALAAKLAALGPEVASYRVGGAGAQEHALLAKDNIFLPSFLQSAQGGPLLGWLSQLTGLDPAWTSTTSP